jgi:hypothetical protein
MRLTLVPVIATVTAGSLSGWLVAVSTWDAAKAGLLVALSVIAAAALVRLARGLPFTNPDHFEPTEVEQVTGAVKQLARSLRALLGLTLAAMVLLVLATPVKGGLLPIPPWATAISERALSTLIGAALAFVLARMWQIVGSDIGLIDKQAAFVVRAVHRKQRKLSEERERDSTIPTFETPEGYGKRLQ